MKTSTVGRAPMVEQAKEEAVHHQPRGCDRTRRPMRAAGAQQTVGAVEERPSIGEAALQELARVGAAVAVLGGLRRKLGSHFLSVGCQQAFSGEKCCTYSGSMQASAN